MKKYGLFLCILFVILLSSCQPQQVTIVVTATPEPTTQPISTATPTIEPTPTPDGQIFRDDFTTELQPGWEWFNENSNTWDITQQGWLRITSEDQCLISNHYQNNLLMRDAPVNGNFKIDTQVEADTTSNFQQASIFIYEDDGNYFTINRGYCDICPPKGDAIFSDYMYKDKADYFNGRVTDADLVYLRLAVNRDRKEIIAYYATEPDKWVQLRKIPLNITINKIGLGTANCDGGSYSDSLVALFDYFVVSALE
jgi:regulation of enolase protein 1 (concanavalin A-like superfamily)